MHFSSKLKSTLKPQLKMIYQSESAECGLACLTMISQYFGNGVSITTLRSRFPSSLKGANLSTLIRISGALALSARPLRAEMTDLANLRVPCILHWNLDHFVVLAGVKGNLIHLFDPAVGERRMTLAEVSDYFTGVAVEFIAAPEFILSPTHEISTIRGLLGRIHGLRMSLAQVFAFAAALELFVVVNPFFMQWVIDGAIVSSDYDLLSTLGISFLLMTLLQAGIMHARSRLIIYLSADMSVQWATNVFSHLLRLPVSFFEKRKLADVVSRFDSLHQIQNTLSSSFVEVFLDGIMALITLGMMLIYSAKLATIAVMVMAIYFFARWLWYKPLRKSAEGQIIMNAAQQGSFLESIRGIQTIKLFGAESERQSRWSNAFVSATNRDIQSKLLTLRFSTLSNALFGFDRVVIIWFGATLIMGGNLSVGMLFAFIWYKDQFSLRLSNLIDKGINLRMLRLHAERLADIVETPTESNAVNRSDHLGLTLSDQPELVLKDVSFRYAEGEPWILSNISLTIGKGELVAIAGASGCGKTTLLKIMLGLLRPDAGTVLFEGRDIWASDISTYREKVSAVMQDDQLFAGSVADNISFFEAGAKQPRIEECASAAAIHGDILSMPMRYSSLVGDMGSALSGGQKQRIFIARAIYRNPKILFLDEATSHLDSLNEIAVNEAICRLDLTRVAVAHRAETLATAERVLVLEAGKIQSESTVRVASIGRPAPLKATP